MSVVRSRWAAIGAAIAVSLGAGGIGLVRADVGSGDRAVLIPITPCRIADTRPATQVGPKETPIGPNETHTITAWGTTGNCTIPTDATALSLNVTAVGATTNTFLTIWGNGTRPDASSLNPLAGAGPNPNAVNTPLTTTGTFNIYNAAGNVNIIIDINGYYANHNHDDRYYTKNQTDNRYYTKTLGDDRYVSIPTTEIVLNTLDAWPAATPSEWSFSLNWNHGASGIECLLIPVEIPVGAIISRLEVTYEAATEAAVTLQVFGLQNIAGDTDSAVHGLSVDDVALPATAASTLGSASGSFTGDLVARADKNYAAAICTADAISVAGARIILG